MINGRHTHTDSSFRTGTTESLRRGEARLDILIQHATPHLYHSNAFRILGATVEATSRDISRCMQLLRMQERYGGGPGQRRGVMAIGPPPDSVALREAVQRVNDPERRLIDELFWFWPSELGQSANDEALRALAEGRTRKAYQVWCKAERDGTDDVASKHNIAVLTHAMALDLEQKGFSSVLSEHDVQQREYAWRHAFRRWRVLIQDERFWTRLALRIRYLDDPRLRTRAKIP